MITYEVRAEPEESAACWASRIAFTTATLFPPLMIASSTKKFCVKAASATEIGSFLNIRNGR